MLSDACEYGLRAVVWLAQHPGEPQKVREIAEGTRSAPGYLVKVLQLLAKAGILSAQRGSHGGFTLERSPESLTVLQVINAIDPIERIHRCPLKIDSHGQNLCPMHQRIDDAMAAIEQSFSQSTLTDLLNEPATSRPLCRALCDPSQPNLTTGQDVHESI
ncbi:MAG: Rrf2 family transcriptional regulator [Phycisphaeraceae bacterium]|nr:Rrf2 family transcriptional regulator [Phycisphaeraceae bacterium]